MSDPVALIGLLFLIGIVGFFVMCVVLVVRFLGFVFRVLFGASSEPEPLETPPTPGNASKAVARVPPPPPHGRGPCPHPRCGHVNPSGARFCRRCGRAIRAGNEVSAHG